MNLGRSGAIYNVGGGAEVTLNEVIALAEELSGQAIDVRHRARANGDVRRTASDTARIRGDVGWEPKTCVRDGLAEQLGWVRAVAEPVVDAAYA